MSVGLGYKQRAPAYKSFINTTKVAITVIMLLLWNPSTELLTATVQDVADLSPQQMKVLMGVSNIKLYGLTAHHTSQ